MENEKLNEEWNWSLFQGYQFTSINNHINEVTHLNIDSVNEFSFGEEEEKEEKEEKKNSDFNENYSNFLGEVNEKKIQDEIDFINSVRDIKEPKSLGKICGFFTKDDFDIKGSNNKLNMSLQEKFHNPLEDDFFEDERVGINPENTKLIPINSLQNSNNNNENDINNDIVNQNGEPQNQPKTETSKNEPQQEPTSSTQIDDEKKSQTETNPTIKETKTDVQNNPIEEEKKDDDNSLKEQEQDQEKEQEKEEQEEVKNNDDSKPSTSPEIVTSILPVEEEKTQVKPIKIPPTTFHNISQSDSSRNHQSNLPPAFSNNPISGVSDSIISSKSKETKEEFPSTKNLDSSDSIKKINELTERLEKSENKYKIVNETNSKLLELINIFRVLQTLDQKKPHSNYNKKKKVFSPTLNENFEKEKNDKKKSRSMSKGKITHNEEGHEKQKLFIDFVQTKKKTYSEMYRGGNYAKNFQEYKNYCANRQKKICNKKVNSYSYFYKGDRAVQSAYYSPNEIDGFQEFVSEKQRYYTPSCYPPNYENMANNIMMNSNKASSPNTQEPFNHEYNLPMSYNEGAVEDKQYNNPGPMVNKENNDQNAEPNDKEQHTNENIEINQNNSNSVPQQGQPPSFTRHRLLDYNAFQVIFDGDSIEAKKSSKSSKSSKRAQENKPPSERKEVENFSPSEKRSMENPEKESPEKESSVDRYFENHPSVTKRAERKDVLSTRNEKYTIPFYLLPQKELYENIINFVFEKPKKFNVIYNKRPKKRSSTPSVKNKE